MDDFFLKDIRCLECLNHILSILEKYLFAEQTVLSNFLLISHSTLFTSSLPTFDYSTQNTSHSSLFNLHFSVFTAPAYCSLFTAIPPLLTSHSPPFTPLFSLLVHLLSYLFSHYSRLTPLLLVTPYFSLLSSFCYLLLIFHLL